MDELGAELDRDGNPAYVPRIGATTGARTCFEHHDVVPESPDLACRRKPRDPRTDDGDETAAHRMGSCDEGIEAMDRTRSHNPMRTARNSESLRDPCEGSRNLSHPPARSRKPLVGIHEPSLGD